MIKKNKEIALVVVTFAGMTLILYWLLGFYSSGIDTPFRYGGGDVYGYYAYIKNLGHGGKYWINNFTGAPFSSNEYDYAAAFLQNTDKPLSFILYKITNNIFATANIQYMLTFPICMVVAYVVLRVLGIGVIFSWLGAITYGFAPVIFGRGIHHFCLSACYFVPLSILLCIWIYEDDSFLRLDKAFFMKRKNISAIIFSFLIANNGIAYYPFFTCFFMGITMVCGLLNGKKWQIIWRGIKNIILIVFFMALSLILVIFYHVRFGSNGITIRTIGDAEQYSLKISQFFIPIYGHGIEKLENLIDTYNTNMPLVNENACSYLGLAAGIGFIISVICVFIRNKDEKNGRLALLGMYNIAAVIFFTVGGLISVISVVLEQYSLRGYNRVSIFVMFSSIIVVCSLADSVSHMGLEKVKRMAIYAGVCLIFAVSIWIQLPSRGYYYDSLENNKINMESDRKFVEYIESEAGEGAMIYQLPYHRYPEGGPQIGMPDYALMTGYFYSDTLKWSYGAPYERYSDLWNRQVAQLEMDDMLEVIARAGFSGIYIDQRAYDIDTLSAMDQELVSLLGTDKVVSHNGALSYYSMKGYLDEHPELSDKRILSLEEISEYLDE